MRSSVDEVREGDESGGETDRRAIERCNENVWVGVKRVGDFKVIGNKVAEGLTANIGSFCYCAEGRNVGSAVDFVSILVASRGTAKCSRGEEAAFPSQDGNIDVIAPCGFPQQAGEAVVEISG